MSVTTDQKARTGTLWLLPATLDNLKDTATASALDSVIPAQVMQKTASLAHFVVENAKSARAYLKRVDHFYPLETTLQDIVFEELSVHTSADKLPRLLDPLLSGQDCGLLSEAGLPAIADPGSALVRLAHEQGICVRPMTGPSSLMLALMASGLNGQTFAFHGYLPTDAGERVVRLKTLEKTSRAESISQIVIETPYRNQALFEAILATCQPSTRLCVALDLTLATEDISTKSIAQWQKAVARGNSLSWQKRPAVFLFLA